MKYLGLDLGTRTLGVSISDLTKLVATTYTTIRFSDSDYESAINELSSIIEKEPIEKIVLGLPKNMNNTVGDRALTTLEFKTMLEEAFGIEVVMQDERLTTKEASSYMIKADMSRKKRKQKIDSLAANIILQTYLDKERNEKSWKEKKN
ncbi:MAG: Holliday junction resolvase RuvX [Bacilli bacterium]|nr:Holliday junction resolvase RuvX [Bacilli bacterium]